MTVGFAIVIPAAAIAFAVLRRHPPAAGRTRPAASANSAHAGQRHQPNVAHPGCQVRFAA